MWKRRLRSRQKRVHDLSATVVTQPSDREGGPFGPEVVAPGCAPLDDGEVSRGDLAFDADLVARVLGHPSGAPALYSCNVQIW